MSIRIADTKRTEPDYELILAAALAGERCPFSHPHGPLATGTPRALIDAGRVRFELYRHNWRVAVILTGPHAGQKTMLAGDGTLKPYRVNGAYIGRAADRRRNRLAPADNPLRKPWNPNKPRKES